MKRKSFLSYLVVFFATLTLAVACNNPASNIDTNTNAGGGTNGETPVRLGFSAWPGWFPWQVAKDQGIFEQNNVNVDLKWFDGYLESILKCQKRTPVGFDNKKTHLKSTGDEF